MEFKKWLLSEDGSRTGCKLGLYPSLADSLGQYPPLYSVVSGSDFITYFNMQYPNGIKMRSPGIVDPSDMLDIHHHNDVVKHKYPPMPKA